MNRLTGKTIWITGASSGIGESMALLLSKKNNRLILSSRNKEKLETIKSECEKNGSECHVHTLDLSDQKSVEETAEQVLAQFDKIDLLINNGGISQRSFIAEAPVEVDRKIMEINFFGQVALTKKVLPAMIKNKSGHIAVTSSIVGKFGFPLRSAYSSSKHALHGFFETLKIEQRPNNIQVSIIIPGRVRTNISVNAIDKTGSAQGTMDHGQEEGMDPGLCAKKIIKALEKGKYEIVVGGKEVMMVYIRKYLKGLFFKIAGKVKPT